MKVGDKIKILEQHTEGTDFDIGDVREILSVNGPLIEVFGDVCNFKLSTDNKNKTYKIVDHYIIPQSRAEIEGSPLSTQVGGSHYKDFKIQPIEYIQGNGLNFCQGNIIKYATRYNFKNGIEDLKKAKHYIDLLIELEYGKK